MPDEASAAGSPPSLAEIERTSREFHQLASTIGDQLKSFEEWFNALPGKSAVSVVRDASFAEPRTLLQIDRYRDATWKLSFGCGTDEDGAMPLFSLENASLVDKCRAVSMLPDLLQELYNEQRAAVDRLKAAAGVFAQLPSAKGGK